MKKKILVGIALMLLCLSFSISAFALTAGDWEFQLLDDEVVITGYVGEGGDAVIPSEIYGRPVTKVEGGSGGIGMLHNKVTSITFPSTVKVINDNFRHWASAGFDKTLKKVIIPEGVEVISENAFGRCVNLESIVLPSTIKEIGTGAFQYCYSLQSVVIAQSSKLEKIGNHAFLDCGNLKEIYLPDSLQEIGGSAFSNTAIEELYVPNIEKKGNGLFSGCTNLKKVVIGTGTIELPEGMFDNCKKLEYVELPNTLVRLNGGSYWGGAFEGCAALEQIVLPSSLKHLGDMAFSGCSSLKEVVVPYGVEFVGDSFQECENLEAVYIPDSVQTLKADVTSNSPNCIIYCTKDSNAAQVCKKNGISYLTDNSVNSLITVYYNGTRVSFHEQGQNPELINSRTLVPLRAIFEAMDAEVEWNQETKTVTATRDGVEISISIGANVMYKDGEEIAVDVPAQLINDRTMVPVRVIAEAFGADVEWNNNGRAVLIEE